MSSLTTLARPYAKAAFELAQGEQSLADWDDMLSMASNIAMDESMSGLLDSPLVSKDQAVKIITDTGGQAFSNRFRDFLSVLSSNGRVLLLPQITSLYQLMREKAEKRLRVTVVSALPLDEDQVDRMREALAQRFDCEIELDSEIDADILGGAVIYAGDQVIDGSLRGRVHSLSNSLAN
jgi:F-type H+-transporting ATPase subunit delta